MVTDKDTQIQILTTIVKKLMDKLELDHNSFLKSEFKSALVMKYNTLKYPSMNVTITHK